MQRSRGDNNSLCCFCLSACDVRFCVLMYNMLAKRLSSIAHKRPLPLCTQATAKSKFNSRYFQVPLIKHFNPVSHLDFKHAIPHTTKPLRNVI